MAKNLPEELTVQTILGVRTIVDNYSLHQMPIEVFDEIIYRCKAYESLVEHLKNIARKQKMYELNPNWGEGVALKKQIHEATEEFYPEMKWVRET